MIQQTTNRDTGEAAATNAPANSATSTSTPDNRPTPLDAFEVLLITGMSGAGRSHAADCVEDMGWYVVDNLPPKLLIPLVDMMTTSGSGSESGVHKLAAVIDVRSSYFDELAAVLGHLDDLGVKTRILFLDASNEVLIKRYESVRRPHPLQHGNRLIDGILEERHLLEDLKERADWVIDTSSLSIHQLSTKLYEAMLGSGPTTVQYTSSASASNTVCPSTPISWPPCVFCPTRSGCPACASLPGTTSRSPTTCFPAREPRNFSTLMRKLSRLRWKDTPRKTSTT